jgi:hypothetical protein
MSTSTKIHVIRFPFTVSEDSKVSFGKTVTEEYGSLAKAFLSLGYDKAESRVKALNEASIDRPYVIKVSASEYGAVIPDRYDFDGMAKANYIDACFAKAFKKATANASTPA